MNTNSLQNDAGSNGSEPDNADYFDSILDSPEILDIMDKGRLSEILDELFSGKYCLLDVQNTPLCGTSSLEAPLRKSIEYDFEPVAYLEYETDQSDKVSLATNILNLHIQGAARYTMASKLHIEAISEDFKRLYTEHKALESSEAKYKSLSEELEQRVDQQVVQIQNTQIKLYESEKMAAIGQLAAGMAHEINNPIGFIQSNLSVIRNYAESLTGLREKLESGTADDIRKFWEDEDLDFAVEDLPCLIKESLEGTSRVAKIISNLKDFSNIDHDTDAQVNLNEIIRTTCAISQSSLNENIRILQHPGNIPETVCRPGYLGQALLNIVSNATQAIGNETGKIEISSSFENNHILITVSDDGPGIPDDIIHRVCDPFYTTREVGSGTGLGLSMARDIVTAHDGELIIDSTFGVGTCVTLKLPVKE